ncbi:PrgI family protein [Anaerobium acetethylicum]|uniref:PrgI family protein n=1 Tax=Anaerobium acetethylicum TaxID=1619234 RepID=A0A1D3TWK8_9FIRM|nr:PrgI family protein [Anaerobium acetethylicum]SCP98627.1 PrgI family protein [Anaerobium acetethylicum]
MVIEINKDIDRYQESVVMGLTARQILFSMVSLISGAGLILVSYRHIGLTAASYVAVPVVAPIALGGYYSYNGMGFYEVMGRKLRFAFANKVLAYASTEGEAAIREFGQETVNKPENKARNQEQFWAFVKRKS